MRLILVRLIEDRVHHWCYWYQPKNQVVHFEMGKSTVNEERKKEEKKEKKNTIDFQTIFQ